MTGASSSVVRAAIMVILVLAAPLLGRYAKSINILVLTAFVMILFNPLILRYDLGFALSFLSISGLVLLSPLIIKKFEKGKLAKTPSAIKAPLIETLSAQIFAFPLILYSFSRVSLIAPLSNILILPFIPLTMFLGFVAAILGMISKFLGEIFAYFPFFFLKYMIVVVKLTSKIPFASIEVNKFPIILTILIYILIIISASLLNRKIIIKNGASRIR
ncbi:MAG: ComEC/Rec2 family competence protein, partial [Candidatus Berkelbacteria bacterium]|nr:ComEC/Rec2 family competence protein [Candidatus Berkelbacteria bacterium]